MREREHVRKDTNLIMSIRGARSLSLRPFHGTPKFRLRTCSCRKAHTLILSHTAYSILSLSPTGARTGRHQHTARTLPGEVRQGKRSSAQTCSHHTQRHTSAGAAGGGQRRDRSDGPQIPLKHQCPLRKQALPPPTCPRRTSAANISCSPLRYSPRWHPRSRGGQAVGAGH